MSASSSSNDFLGHALTPGPRPAYRLRGGVGLVVPVVLGGAFAVVALAGRSRLGSWLRGFLSAGDGITRDELRCRLRDDRRPLSELRAMLLGRTKAQVAARFGPPRTAVMRQPAVVAAGGGLVGQAAFWRADTWYYVVNPAEQTAMAVQFDGDRAYAVDFFDAPQGEEGDRDGNDAVEPDGVRD